MSRLGFFFFGKTILLGKSALNGSFCRIRPRASPNQWQMATRLVHAELPDEDSERQVSLDNFEETYSRLKLPFKMQHPVNREPSKKFIKLRLEQFPKGMSELKLEDYGELYEHLEGEQRDNTINDISMILNYYNRILSKSIFCPKTIPVEDMKKMLHDYPSYNGRIRYVHFLFVREFDIWRLDLEESRRREERDRKEKEELASFNEIGCFNAAGELQYGYWRNTMFSRYYERSVSKYSLHRLRTAQQFGQPIVVDVSFDDRMADYETISVARQISSIYHTNRFSADPFHLLFCGYRESNRGYQHTARMLNAIIENKAFYFNLHAETYQEMLPNERLVYLSPDARKLMTEFDPNAVYIIGALVSKTHKSMYTYEKATREGIECVRLPIHEYVELKPGVKRVLSFHGVFKILLELKQHGNWERAFRAGILPWKLVDGETRQTIKCD